MKLESPEIYVYKWTLLQTSQSLFLRCEDWPSAFDRPASISSSSSKQINCTIRSLYCLSLRSQRPQHVTDLRTDFNLIMADTKVNTVIENLTQQELVLRVGNRNCFAKLATVAVRGEHILEFDVNWTYQEFSLEPAKAGDVLMKIILNSDDCCDYERMTVTESGDKLHVDKVARQINPEINEVDHRPESRPKVANWRSPLHLVPDGAQVQLEVLALTT